MFLISEFKHKCLVWMLFSGVYGGAYVPCILVSRSLWEDSPRWLQDEVRQGADKVLSNFLFNISGEAYAVPCNPAAKGSRTICCSCWVSILDLGLSFGWLKADPVILAPG